MSKRLKISSVIGMLLLGGIGLYVTETLKTSDTIFSHSPEIELLKLASSNEQRGYATPASGHSVPTPINGQCGSAASDPNNTSAPSGSALCAVGSASSVSGDYDSGWSWSCQGSNGGSNVSCDTPPVNAQCGTAAAETDRTSAPSTNLCGRGIASSVTGDRQNGWSWSCIGGNGGTDTTCDTVGICDAPHDYYPAVDVDVSATFENADPWGTNVSAAAPADQVRIDWDWDYVNSGIPSFVQSPGVTCTQSFSYPTDVITLGEHLGIGDTQLLAASCTENYCGLSDSAGQTIGIADVAAQLSVDAELARAGRQVELSWDVVAAGGTPFPMDCELFGAASSSFAVPDESSGNILSEELINSREALLRCVEPVTEANSQDSVITDSILIEVVPEPEER